MELVVDEKLFLFYIMNHKPSVKEDKILNLISAIEGESNKIKMSTQYLSIIEDYISKQYTFNDREWFIQNINHLYENNHIKECSYEGKSDLNNDDLLQNIFLENHTDYTFLLTKEKRNFSNPNVTRNVSVFDKVQKPNKDWVILSLCSGHTVTLRYSNFSKNKEIIEIFTSIARFHNEEKKAIILDPYLNLTNFSLLKCLLGTGYEIHCYSKIENKKNEKRDFDKSNKRTNVKKFFGNGASVKFSCDSRIIHQRGIYISSLCINPDHDFDEISTSNHNWQITIQISQTIKAEVENKIKKYNN